MNGHYSARDTHWAQKLSAAPACTRTLSTRVVRHLQLKSNQRRVEEQPSAGTENVLLAVGLGAACRLARDHPCTVQLEGLTAYFWTRLRARMGDRIALNGHRERRLPNTLNVGFRGQIRSGVARQARRGGCLDRLGVPQRLVRDVAGAAVDGVRPGDRSRRSAIQRGPSDNGSGARSRGGSARAETVALVSRIIPQF